MNHMDWGIRFWEYGTTYFYDANVWSFTWPNQPPGTMYIFAIVRKLFEFIFGLFWTLNIKISIFPSGIITYLESNLYPALIHMPAILADFGIAYLIYKFTNKQWASILWLINPVIWYNSSVWGQYDSVINFLALLSFYFLLKKKLVLSSLSLALSLYTKFSLVIFVPIWLIIALKQNYGFKRYALTILCSLFTVLLLSFPFSKDNPIEWLYYLYKDKVLTQQMQVITANAFNFWSLLTGPELRSHSLPFIGLTYQIWGYILFGVFYLLLLYRFFRLVFINHNSLIINLVWSLALTAFSSFMLLTNMHERYLYPLFPYLTILVGMRLVSVYPYIFISLLSLFNMYNLWFVPNVPWLVSVMSLNFNVISRLSGFFALVYFLYLYFRYNLGNGKNLVTANPSFGNKS
mgnify:CR=1 FL=1